MKPSSKNEAMNGLVKAYIAQKKADKADGTHHADTWKHLNGEATEIKKYDLASLYWKGLAEAMATFETAVVTYKDGHTANSILWKDGDALARVGGKKAHVYAIEMNEIGSVTFHVADFDGSEKEAIKPTDETSSSVLAMLLALDNVDDAAIGDVPSQSDFEELVKVTPTDINVDANGYAILEHDGTEITGQAKKVKFAQTDKSASFSEVTIPSASDLKTKDGTGFGLNILTLNLNECMSENDFNELVQYINQEIVVAKIYDITLPDLTGVDVVKFNIVSAAGTFHTTFYRNSKNISQFNWLCNWANSDNFIQMVTITGFTDNTVNTIKYNGIMQTDASDLATTEQLNAKQPTLYRHTITIYEGNTQDGNSVCFTAYTPSNTPIDSIQDLTASADGSNKLANTDLACFGVSGTAEALVLYNGIHIGTDLASTTFRKAVGGSVAFSSAFATYTITDDVTLN